MASRIPGTSHDPRCSPPPANPGYPGALVVKARSFGYIVGDLIEAWNKAADLSAERNIRWYKKPYREVLSCAPAMYDELWTAPRPCTRWNQRCSRPVRYHLCPAPGCGQHVHGKLSTKSVTTPCHISERLESYKISRWGCWRTAPRARLGGMGKRVEKPTCA